jgi:hypothetical protein
MSKEIYSNLKVKADCECGCGLHGTPRARPLGHIRGCKCKRCEGKRNRSKGDAKALKARKVLGIAGANTRHEELWGGDVRVEVKAGAQVNPIATRYMLAEQQSEQHRPVGDPRPFILVAMPDGMSDGLVVMRLSSFAQYTGMNTSQE